MSNTENTGIIKNYTLTAFLSFTLIFCCLVLFSTCHGEYKSPTLHHNSSKQNKEIPKH